MCAPEAVKVIQAWYRGVLKPRRITTDNGPEFQAEFKRTCEEWDSKQRTSLPGEPWTNVRIERANQTLNKGTAMGLAQAGAPLHLAHWARHHFVFCRNRLFRQEKFGGATPYLKRFSVAYEDDIIPFCCEIYYAISDTEGAVQTAKPHKYGAAGIRGILLSYHDDGGALVAELSRYLEDGALHVRRVSAIRPVLRDGKFVFPLVGRVMPTRVLYHEAHIELCDTCGKPQMGDLPLLCKACRSRHRAHTRDQQCKYGRCGCTDLGELCLSDSDEDLFGDDDSDDDDDEHPLPADEFVEVEDAPSEPPEEREPSEDRWTEAGVYNVPSEPSDSPADSPAHPRDGRGPADWYALSPMPGEPPEHAERRLGRRDPPESPPPYEPLSSGRLDDDLDSVYGSEWSALAGPAEPHPPPPPSGSHRGPGGACHVAPVATVTQVLKMDMSDPEQREALQAEVDGQMEDGVLDREFVEKEEFLRRHPDAVIVGQHSVMARQHVELPVEQQRVKARTVLGGHDIRDAQGNKMMLREKGAYEDLRSDPAMQADVKLGLALGHALAPVGDKVLMVHRDIKRAYHKAPMRGSVIGVQLKGKALKDAYGVGHMRRPVSQALKAGYGIDRAGKDFEHWRNGKLKKKGWTQLTIARSIFFITDGTRVCILIAYVDDLLFITSESFRPDKDLDFEWKGNPDASAAGVVESFLGQEISNSLAADGAWEIVISQAPMTRLIVADFQRKLGKPLRARRTDTPALAMKEGLTENPGVFADSCRHWLGRTQYLGLCSRPDSLCSSASLATFVADWREEHDRALTRQIKYLRDTAEHALVLRVFPGGKISILAESDAEQGGCPETRKPLRGAAVYLITEDNDGNEARALVGFFCNRQTTIARSSCESELSALVALVQRLLIYLLEAMQELLGHPTPARVRVDNSSAIDLVRAGYSRKLAYLKRWVGVDLGWLHEIFYSTNSPWLITLEKVDTLENSSDIFTKGLFPERFEYLCSLLGIRGRTTSL